VDEKPYISIKSEVLIKLEAHLPEIQSRFGIESLGVFGSVSRGEDTPESDIDILYKFKPGIKTYHALLDLGDYLEELLGRKVDLVSSEWVSPYLKPYIDAEVILYGQERGAV
jgi:hypothetical protein